MQIESMKKAAKYFNIYLFYYIYLNCKILPLFVLIQFDTARKKDLITVALSSVSAIICCSRSYAAIRHTAGANIAQKFCTY